MFSYAYSRLFMTRWANTGTIPGASWFPLNGGSLLPVRVIFAAAIFAVFALFSTCAAADRRPLRRGPSTVSPGAVIEAPDCLTPTPSKDPQTIVGIWNCAALVEMRASKPLRNGPPVVARALAIAHTCLYDAWAAYDPVALGTVLGGNLRRPAAERTDANKAKAISFAAYRCLLNLYPDDGSYNVPPAPTPPTPSGRLRAALVAHGYD